MTGRPIVGSARWRLDESDGYLVAVAGADEMWVVDDLPGSVADELHACWTDRPPTPDQLSAAAQLAVEQLRAVGVFGTPNTLPATPALGVRWAGEPVPALLDTLINSCAELGWPAPVEVSAAGVAADASELEIVVRSTSTLASTAALAAGSTAAGSMAAGSVVAGRLQLFCDLASIRTVALGPFVVGGHSACIGCLAGRVGSRWGDPQPPNRPGATGTAGATAAAALIIQQVGLAVDGRFPLVDATVSIDLDTLESRRSPCLRSSRCRFCADRLTDGRVALPWVEDPPTR